jgi:hypothetical protein
MDNNKKAKAISKTESDKKRAWNSEIGKLLVQRDKNWRELEVLA